MFYLIGLTYYMDFPKTVKETNRWFFDFGLRWLSETMIDFSIFSFKKMLKHRDEFSGHLSFRQRIESMFEWTNWVYKKIQNNSCAMSVIQNQHVKALTFFVLPSMLRSRTGVLVDPIFVLYTPRLCAEMKNILMIILMNVQLIFLSKN